MNTGETFYKVFIRGELLQAHYGRNSSLLLLPSVSKYKTFCRFQYILHTGVYRHILKCRFTHFASYVVYTDWNPQKVSYLHTKGVYTCCLSWQRLFSMHLTAWLARRNLCRMGARQPNLPEIRFIMCYSICGIGIDGRRRSSAPSASFVLLPSQPSGE